jgi:hypothetical protein
MKNDVWVDYQPQCTGTLRVTTCEPDGPSPETTLAVYRADAASGALCPADGGVLYEANDDAPATPDEAQFNTQRCSLGAETCATDDDCVLPNAHCMGDGECVLSCATDAECEVNGLPAGRCAEGRCERPCETDADCLLKSCSIRGNLCTVNTQCTVGVTSWSGDECDTSVPPPRVCRVQPDIICTIGGGECALGDVCIFQTCIPVESCELEICQSSCWPGSAVTVPVSHLDTYKVRLGGEYGSEPVGALRLICTDGDCNVNAVPDVCELSCDNMDGLCAHFTDCGTAVDCHTQGGPGYQRVDSCDIRVADGGFCTGPTPPCSRDCQGNGIPDECEVEPDSDGDSVLDICDACPNSDLTDTIVIAGCHTGVANQVLDDGCTMTETLADCAAGDPNHGQFVRCVVPLTNEWRRDGLLTGKDRARVVRCAAASNDQKLPNRVDKRGDRGAGDRNR